MEIIFHEDIALQLITEQLSGCECESDCICEEMCRCLSRCGSAYNKHGLLTSFEMPVFECNSNCLCDDATCNNRVVQRHLSSPCASSSASCISREGSISGHGVFATRMIQQGELVCIYLGEVIPKEVASLREAEQQITYGRNYILHLRNYSAERLISETCIDGDAVLPTGSKALARLINHSCSPNLDVIPVYVDNMVPYAAMFAKLPIQADSELTYDYANCVPVDRIRASATACLCMSNTCRGYLPAVQ